MLTEIQTNPMPMLIAQARRAQDTSEVVFTEEDKPAYVGEVASFQQTQDYAHYIRYKCAASEKRQLETRTKLKELTHGATIPKPIAKVAETPQIG